MESIVISIGGSVILSDDVETSFFVNLKNMLKKFSKDFKIYLIVGGGKTARTYIQLCRKLNFDEKILDQIGIEITRINAQILTKVIDFANIKIPFTTDEAIKINKPIVIMGGTTPGHSTDMVGAELAEKAKASRYIIATNVDGVYDKDPNKYPDAKQIKEISINKLIEEHGTDWSMAGKNVVIDGPALKIIKRAKLSTFILNGKRLGQLELALLNKNFDGTKIKI